jgi:hypothetical protein
MKRSLFHRLFHLFTCLILWAGLGSGCSFLFLNDSSFTGRFDRTDALVVVVRSDLVAPSPIPSTNTAPT